MTYEYECTNCYYEWEQEQKITEEPIKECPKCKQKTAHRLVVCGGFVLNGSCWAKDGYSG